MPGDSLLGKCVTCCTPPVPPTCSFTCESKQGSGSLCGQSKPQNHNAGDWNLRKFTRVRRTGSYVMNCCHSNVTNCVGGGQQHRIILTWPTDAVFDPGSSCARTGGEGVQETIQNCGAGSTSSGDAGFTADLNLATITTCNSNTMPKSVVTTDFTVTVTVGSGCHAFISDSIQLGGSSVLQELLEPDTVDAALARGSPTTGSACRTLKGTIGTTTANATGTLSVTGVRSVKATILSENLIDGVEYKITLTFSRYTPGTNTFIEDFEEEHTFTFHVSEEFPDSDEMEVHVPIEDSYDVEIVSCAIEVVP